LGDRLLRLAQRWRATDEPAAKWSGCAETASTVIAIEPLREGGRGNIIAAAGSYLVDLLERA
jgi:hypothetical protein